MPKICYLKKTFSPTVTAVIDRANDIIHEYASQGFDLTLRQLYYQFVARGYIPNRDSEYNKLGDIISDARLAGLIDWDSIVDRTRNVRINSHWTHPAKAIETASASYRKDLWAIQPNYVEVWIEKDALVGVIAGICSELDVPYSRAKEYIQNYGNLSWELDALDPRTLAGLIRSAVMQLRDEKLWQEGYARQERGRAVLKTIAKRWKEVTAVLQNP